MTRKLIRKEKFAVIGKEDQIRVLVNDERSARNIALNLSKALAATGPYRVARVQVDEILSEAA